MVNRLRSYGEMMVELQSLLAEMQSDALDVDTALANYERGKELLRQLEDYLKTAGNKITHTKGELNTEAD